MENQIVTVTFFRFQGLSNKFWAFTMMQVGHKRLSKDSNAPGFYKLLGSGGEDGFSWKPNFSVYGLLCVWDNKQQAEDFYGNSMLLKDYRSKSKEHFTIHLKSIKSHGSWSNSNPFIAQADHEKSGKVAVLTRATIRFSKLISFWRRVAGVSNTLTNFSGRQFSIGIGEWPWIQQATFSIWDSEEQMKDYAYTNPVHKKIIQMTREKKWYREEMFARFRPIRAEGRWKGAEISFLN